MPLSSQTQKSAILQTVKFPQKQSGDNIKRTIDPLLKDRSVALQINKGSIYRREAECVACIPDKQYSHNHSSQRGNSSSTNKPLRSVNIKKIHRIFTIAQHEIILNYKCKHHLATPIILKARQLRALSKTSAEWPFRCRFPLIIEFRAIMQSEIQSLKKLLLKMFL